MLLGGGGDFKPVEQVVGPNLHTCSKPDQTEKNVLRHNSLCSSVRLEPNCYHTNSFGVQKFNSQLMYHHFVNVV